MSASVKYAIKQEMKAAIALFHDGQLDQAFQRFERAHILAQRYFWAHAFSHVWMLRVALAKRDVREQFGQVNRLIATIPGYVLGWVPVGNTGGANVSPLKPMPIPDDLAVYFKGYNVWRGVAWRAVLAIGVVLAGFAVATNYHNKVSQIEDQWAARTQVEINDLGSISSLTIISVVNFHAASPRFQTEAGVAYLVKTHADTILFDVGWNEHARSPSPLEHNLQQIGQLVDDIDTIFLSHNHHDHVGGGNSEREQSFALGLTQPKLAAKRAFAASPTTYPGLVVDTISEPRKLFEGVSSTGPISRQLALGKIDEQALVIHLEGIGLVVIVGCGHQTIPKLLTRVQETVDIPIYAVIGDLHYPVPQGRRVKLGIDLQRTFASGSSPFAPIEPKDVQADLDLLAKTVTGFVALGTHDSSDDVLTQFEARLGPRFKRVLVGEEIRL